MSNLDMLICIVPKLMPDAPTVGPAILKSNLLEAGYTCEIIDLNVKLFNELKKNGDEKYYFENDSVFLCRDVESIDDGSFQVIYEKYQYVFDEWITIFKNKNPSWIGLSLLSMMSSAVGIKLSQLIREHLPNTKIVWGGAEVNRHRTKKFFNQGLIDHWVSGDGEEPIVNLLRGEINNSGIDDNEPFQMLNLNANSIPNYDDIDWDEYNNITFKNPAYVTGSRGCVKRCDFCNVYATWPKYIFRSGENIANEVIQLKEKYDRTTFKFTDSLINGSMKAFRDMLQILAEYNMARPAEDRVCWHSQWIVRNLHQSPESDYELMKNSGCVSLDVGIESFSQHVRYEMGKKFTDDDMWWCFKMLQKYEIHHTLLMFVGHPYETDEDHQVTLSTLRELAKHGYMGKQSITGKRLMYISMANTMMLDTDSPIWHKVQSELEYWHNDWNWKFRDSTLDKRLARLEEANALISELSGQQKSWMVLKKIKMIKESFG